MKMKQSFFALTAVAALTLTVSCGGGGTSSASGAGESCLFGEIPGIYEKRQVDFAQKMKQVKEDKNMEEALKLLAGLKETLEEAGKEAQPLADKMVGTAVAYSQGDSLAYKVVSEITVEKVRLPELGIMNGGDKPVRLDVKFDAVVTQEVEAPLRMYYFITDGDVPVGYGRTSGLGRPAVGDTLHVEETVYAPDAPAEYQERCSALRFVTEGAYQAGRSDVDRQQKQWNDEMKEKLGIGED